MSEFAGQTRSSTVAAAAVAELDEVIPLFDWGNTGPTIPDAELRAIFFQYDRDSDGEIDRDELAEAVFRAGYRIPKPMFDEIFLTFDDDCGGTIDFEEFGSFIQKTNLRPERSVKFAMDLFNKYDVDTSGQVDKFEFAELAAEVEANYRRRTLLSGAAAALGGLVVAKYSEECELRPCLDLGALARPRC